MRRFRNTTCRTAQATSQTITATIVWPDNGATAVLHAGPSFTVALASASTVTTPSAVAPTPVARMAAEIAPSGLVRPW